VAGRPEGDLVVVSHGTVVALFVAAATGVEPYAFWNRLGLPSFVVLSLPGLEIARVQWAIESNGEPA
jgi:broad specificity phosphatase PhoE